MASPAKTSPNRTPHNTTMGTEPKRKLPVLPPTSGKEMAMHLLLHLCRSYMFFDITYKLGVYCILVTVFSFIGDLATLPKHYYFTNKHNFLNIIFVKWGMLWTFGLLVPFVYLAARVYSANDLRNIRQQLARLVIAFFAWFVITFIFNRIEQWTGFCTKPTYGDRHACVNNDGRWFSFDASGHCFLLIFCCMVIGEETRVFRNWDRIRELINKAGDPDSEPAELMLLSNGEKAVIKAEHADKTPYVRVLFVALTALNLLWEFMLVITSLYYHNWPQKIAGAAAAAAAWYLLYCVWYRKRMSPGMPGHCKMKYIVPTKRA